MRTGWTKTNSYHVVITSYQLAVQDSFAFKRKKWYYMILDEAQNIKNFQSQRWQTLIHFNTQRRLLLTGTPLQNNLLELWSLLHFLMPQIFRSRNEFSYLFANPMNSMIEGKAEQNDAVIGRLHGIIRPFVLRRLKKDVETEMPGKYEHIIRCSMSRRQVSVKWVKAGQGCQEIFSSHTTFQMYIYEEFMARSSTRQALSKRGNFMGMMNVLMQLRKVCNHPDLFEPRSILTPFVLEEIPLDLPKCTWRIAGPYAEATTSEHLIMPFWCGSSSVASLRDALEYDSITADTLKFLVANLKAAETSTSLISFDEKDVSPALAELLHKENKRRTKEQKDKMEFLDKINRDRCNSGSFLYPLRTQKVVSTEMSFLDKIMNSPQALLSLREKTCEDVANEMADRIKKFVFCVPKANARVPTCFHDSTEEKRIEEVLRGPVEEASSPFSLSRARLSSFFPDKKLIQYDAGKLQTLAELLRELKRGGHKALIFTQMSKMLDILEAFLNLNGHTYLRLDGATGVDRRQRLMDRFNNDPKIFCFILSTRSGGLGINLTGADTCIFYDSDWNPAMDAQAQDRAHRIGQTRDVHIYRLITEHTVEENILLKAKQKKNLDVLVMDKGKFHASQLFGHNSRASDVEVPEPNPNEDILPSLFSAKGLSGILGGSSEETGEETITNTETAQVSSEEVEKTMASLEDEDDLAALQGARREAVEELKEFDESIEYQKDEDESQKIKDSKAAAATTTKSTTTLEDDPQDQDDDDINNTKMMMIATQLSPIERYGLSFCETIDPYYSNYAVMEYQLKLEASSNNNNNNNNNDENSVPSPELWNEPLSVDLLVTDPDPKDLLRQRNLYRREKYRRKCAQMERELTGQAWEVRKDGATNLPFWYNVDTGEAVWDKPLALVELEELENASGWKEVPMKILVHVFSFLSYLPDRLSASQVCHRWKKGATDPSFVLHVYPWERMSMMSEKQSSSLGRNHFGSIEAALEVAQAGDTIELGDGHYSWGSKSSSTVLKEGVRLVGDEDNPSNVIVQLSGRLVIDSKCRVYMEGITLEGSLEGEDRLWMKNCRLVKK